MAEAQGGPPKTYAQVRFEKDPTATEIYLVRHGESEPADPEKPFALVDGRGDPALSERGHLQARLLAKRLQDSDFAAIYVTNLRRTAETAAPLAASLGLDPIVEPDLAEVGMGEWEGGLYRHKMAIGDPLVAKLFAEQRFDIVPGGESNASLISRSTGAIERIVQTWPGRDVIVFSHAVTISALLAHATGASTFAYITADNASISRIVVGERFWSIRAFNDRAHLE